MNKLKTYIEILEDHIEPKMYEKPLLELVDVKSLLENGFLHPVFDSKKNVFISGVNDTRDTIISDCVISPKGAMALVEWKKLIKESKFSYKFFKFIERPLWIVFGFSLPHWGKIWTWLANIF